MELLIWVCGIVIGSVVTILMVSKSRVGTLYIVDSHLEPEPQLLCDLDYPIEKFKKKRYVVMRIDHVSTRD